MFSSRSVLATPRFVRSQSHLSKSSGVSFTSFPNIINGKPRFGSGSYKGENPSNKEQLWDIPIATSEEVDEAVAAAKQAFPAWSRLSQQDRVKKIKAWMDDFIAHEEELKEVLIQETGKPVRKMIFCRSREKLHKLTWHRRKQWRISRSDQPRVMSTIIVFIYFMTFSVVLS